MRNADIRARAAGYGGFDVEAKYKMFRGTMTTWDDLFDDAAQFATELGEMRVINVSHSCAGSDGVVTVWYWSDESSEAAD